MVENRGQKPLFITAVQDRAGRRRLQMLIDSIRSFAGPLRDSQVWVFDISPGRDLCGRMAVGNIDAFPLRVPDPLGSYPFGGKVAACARAEELLSGHPRPLVWLSVDCLIVNPPREFVLQGPVKVALRPVHIQNIGSPRGGPLDEYWNRIYRQVGLEEAPFFVTSFVDRVTLRPYFNTHAFAVDPALGLMARWSAHFRDLVEEAAFQRGACAPRLRKVFLHQALLSALLVRELEADEFRHLPPSYAYPYHLQGDIPPQSRVEELGRLVCITYEGRRLDPDDVQDIRLDERYRSWLGRYLP